MATTLRVRLRGVNPLLLHTDNVLFADKIGKWRKDPLHKGKGPNGDDRHPAFTWIGCLMFETGKVVVSADNLMAMLRDAGGKVSLEEGRGSYKSLTQSSLVVNESSWVLTSNGKEFPAAPIQALIEERDFEVHEAAVEKMGFSLFVKRARIGTQKHVRVRPRFDVWELEGTITLLDPALNPRVLQTILNYAGAYTGLGDWRPGGKTPGQWGRFEVEVSEV